MHRAGADPRDDRAFRKERTNPARAVSRGSNAFKPRPMGVRGCAPVPLRRHVAA